MLRTKYIAAGFLNDAEKLLKDFAEENSFSFLVFAEKWVAHNFSAIYLGREEGELLQFLQEIFQVTLGYLHKPSLLYQVGAIYLLYALYRNQLTEFTIKDEDKSKGFLKIRLSLPYWKLIKDIKDTATQKNYLFVNYVIDYLCDNAFDFVCFEILYGPTSLKGKADVEKPTVATAFLLKDVKNEATKLLHSGIFEKLKASHQTYEELKTRVLKQEASEKRTDACNGFDDFRKELEDLLSEGASTRAKSVVKTESNIGSRRAAIKAASFDYKASYRNLNPPEENENVATKQSLCKGKEKKSKQKRKRAEDRRVGRPPKNPKPKEEKCTDESDSDSEAIEVPEVHNKKRGQVGRVSYLAEYETSSTILPSIKLKEVRKCTTIKRESDEDEFESEDIDTPDEEGVIEF